MMTTIAWFDRLDRMDRPGRRHPSIAYLVLALSLAACTRDYALGAAPDLDGGDAKPPVEDPQRAQLDP